MILSVLLFACVVYMIISSRRLDWQFARQEEKSAHLHRIVSCERQLLGLIVEHGTLDLYDAEVQHILRCWIAEEKAYMKRYDMDWEADIAKKTALLRNV